VLWKPKPAAMEAFRQHITAFSDEFLKLIRDTEEATGIPITADCYKRPKMPENPDLAPYFAWKGNISCVQEVAPGEEMFGPALGERALELFEKLIPLYEYFLKFTN
jgi:hypothetical protein